MRLSVQTQLLVESKPDTRLSWGTRCHGTMPGWGRALDKEYTRVHGWAMPTLAKWDDAMPTLAEWNDAMPTLAEWNDALPTQLTVFFEVDELELVGVGLG